MYLPQPPVAQPLPQPNLGDLTVPAPGKWPIRFVTGKYRGTFTLRYGDDVLSAEIYDTSKPIFLKPGVWQFDVARIDGAMFTFTVTENGQVTDVTNKVAAHAHGNSLVLHSTLVKLDIGPLGKGGNACELCVYHYQNFGFVRKNTFYYLIPNLTYQFDVGTRTRSAFIFQVGEDGMVRHWNGTHPPTPEGPQMHGGPHLLKLRVGWLDIVPDDSTVSYTIGQSVAFKGHYRVPVIMSLNTNLKTNDLSVPIVVGDHPTIRKLTVAGKSFTVKGPWEDTGSNVGKRP